MAENNNKLFSQLQQRGYLYQATDADNLACVLEQSTQVVYVGFDCTADCLHVGNLVTLMILRLLQRHGHKAIILLGTATTRVGDPSGKDKTRQLLDDATINANAKGIEAIIRKFIPPDSYTMVKNGDWFNDIKYIDFLRDCGRHFTINKMLTLESVKQRLEREQALTFLEFNYVLLQSYDFYFLAKEYGCTMQLGGADQWGNIINGVDLTRRLLGKKVFGITCPLLTTADGKKMGKTANGALWLDANKCSSFDFWNYWRNISDEDVRRFLLLFTDLAITDVDALCDVQGAKINEAKIKLANEVTALCHGKELAAQAFASAKQLFSADCNSASNFTNDNIIKLDDAIFDEHNNANIIDIMLLTPYINTKGEARRAIKNKAIKLNDTAVLSDNAVITKQDLASPQQIKLSLSKKKHVLLEYQADQN